MSRSATNGPDALTRWREVLLATMWRLSRPSELSDLIGVIRIHLRNHIDESPAGLRTREILAKFLRKSPLDHTDFRPQTSNKVLLKS